MGRALRSEPHSHAPHSVTAHTGGGAPNITPSNASGGGAKPWKYWRGVAKS